MSGATETKHTPGPWRLLTRAQMVAEGWSEEKLPERSPLFIVGPPDRYGDEVMVAALPGSWRGQPDDEVLANAAILAAAPDLLEALREVLEVLFDYRSSVSDAEYFITRTCAAIKKATQP